MNTLIESQLPRLLPKSEFGEGPISSTNWKASKYKRHLQSAGMRNIAIPTYLCSCNHSRLYNIRKWKILDVLRQAQAQSEGVDLFFLETQTRANRSAMRIRQVSHSGALPRERHLWKWECQIRLREAVVLRKDLHQVTECPPRHYRGSG